MGVPAEGVAQGLAEAEVEAAAQDVHHDCLAFGEGPLEYAQCLGAGLAEAARVVEAVDARVVADGARSGRGGDELLEAGAGGGCADFVKARRTDLGAE